MASEKETETFKKPDAATILHGVKGKGGWCGDNYLSNT